MKLLFWLELGERRMPVAAVKSTDEERSRRRRVSPESAPWPPAPSRPQVSLLPSVRLTNEEASRLRERRRSFGLLATLDESDSEDGEQPMQLVDVLCTRSKSNHSGSQVAPDGYGLGASAMSSPSASVSAPSTLNAQHPTYYLDLLIIWPSLLAPRPYVMSGHGAG